ncbi:MAG: hypothetical protein ABR929_15715 [Roseiarcus sp.]
MSRHDNQIPVRKISLALLSRRDNHLLAATAELAILFAATLPSRLSRYNVGARVRYGVMLGHHAGAPVFASMDGVLRGIARDGTFVPKGVKLLEIDMRGEAASWSSPDARGRAIAKASVAAIDRCASATRAFGATPVPQNLNRAEHVS